MGHETSDLPWNDAGRPGGRIDGLVAGGAKEPILPDDHPVSKGVAYLCDGEPCSSDVQGTVADLKRHVRAKEVRRCDLVARRYRVAIEGPK